MSRSSDLRRMIRQTLTIARRDFAATVVTPTFLLFLLAPLMMVAFGAVGGITAASMSEAGSDQRRIVMLIDPAQSAAAIATDREFRRLQSRIDGPPLLILSPPQADVEKQARAQFDAKDVDVTAVLYGPLERPQILYGDTGRRDGLYLANLAEQMLRTDQIGSSQRLSQARMTSVTRTTASAGGRGQAAFFTVVALFMVSLMLAGQVVGAMAEERSNKVIEVLAAAVPLESVFFGKLLGMFAVSLLFLVFWGTVILNVGAYLPTRLSAAFADVGPAVGMGPYIILFFMYFMMAYLLLGAVFLGLGAQASTQRELQMMSLPITIFQMGMFGFASAAASKPDSWIATAAEIFPFSSPFAMAARSANSPELWPHLLGIGWQMLWVASTVAIAARLFRRGVLQSGSPKRRKKVEA